MDIVDHFNRRTTAINQRHQFLTNYIKNIETKSPKIPDVLLICDNLANELTILSNELNYRLEIVLKRQENQDKILESHMEYFRGLLDILKHMSTKVGNLERIQTEINVLKAEQKEQIKMRNSLNKFIMERAKQTDPTKKKSKVDLKKRLPGVA